MEFVTMIALWLWGVLTSILGLVLSVALFFLKGFLALVAFFIVIAVVFHRQIRNRERSQKEKIEEPVSESGKSPEEIIAALKAQNARLIRMNQRLNRGIGEASGIINQQRMQDTLFEDEELRFMLMKCHPDHNSGEKIAESVTDKLIQMRRQ